MTIGVLHLELVMRAAHSLKDKRRIVKSLKDRIRARFNCAVAETEHLDLCQRARVTVCVVSNEHQHANTQLNEIARFALERLGPDLADYWVEML